MSGLEEQGLGAESEDLFRAAKKALSPSMADRDRVRARLALKIGVGVAVATVATTSSKAAASAAGAGAAGAAATKTTAAAGIPLFAKIVAPLVIASAVGTVAVAPHVVSRASTTSTTTSSTDHKETSTSPVSGRPAPAITSMPADPAPAAAVSIDDLPNAETSPRAPHVRTAPKARAAAQPTDDTSDEARAREEEAALALQIDAALRANDTARAARLADEHQRRFPNGLLTEEREGARVLIRCSSTPSAAIASEFLQAHPRSPMRARILAACATERAVE